MTRPLPPHPAPPAPEWLAHELAAAPADRPIWEAAREEIFAYCRALGVSALSLPPALLTDLIIHRVEAVRWIDKRIRRFAVPPEGVKRWLTIREAARRIGMSEGFVRDHLLQQDIPGITGKKHGDCWRIDAMALAAYLERRDRAA